MNTHCRFHDIEGVGPCTCEDRNDANRGGHKLSEACVALFFGLWQEIERVWWNNKQEERPDSGTLGAVSWRPYDWTVDPPNPAPNLYTPGLLIWWYKTPGRSMTCNRALSKEAWFTWFED